jgi:hypothetical protein
MPLSPPEVKELITLIKRAKDDKDGGYPCVVDVSGKEPLLFIAPAARKDMEPKAYAARSEVKSAINVSKAAYGKLTGEGGALVLTLQEGSPAPLKAGVTTMKQYMQKAKVTGYSKMVVKAHTGEMLFDDGDGGEAPTTDAPPPTEPSETQTQPAASQQQLMQAVKKRGEAISSLDDSPAKSKLAGQLKVIGGLVAKGEVEKVMTGLKVLDKAILEAKPTAPSQATEAPADALSRLKPQMPEVKRWMQYQSTDDQKKMQTLVQAVQKFNTEDPPKAEKALQQIETHLVQLGKAVKTGKGSSLIIGQRQMIVAQSAGVTKEIAAITEKLKKLEPSLTDPKTDLDRRLKTAERKADQDSKALQSLADKVDEGQTPETTLEERLSGVMQTFIREIGEISSAVETALDDDSWLKQTAKEAKRIQDAGGEAEAYKQALADVNAAIAKMADWGTPQLDMLRKERDKIADPVSKAESSNAAVDYDDAAAKMAKVLELAGLAINKQKSD